ncbi:hypothetical protein [Chelatococcus asaccharovorans]|uniref:Uncharacterized protein n=1 Tax=Chelatococcus asaccharovorans TaxID=28210 RepID=A0A2V3UB72_9HYPH|nr:hypothetical protein [Chelatococcus asaccharovorans]MBS7703342.1 hypothetical protein [Chelatococcus asaccharovorans]PXW61679.1 hypothetical protein C7450_103196 [Chelatococcus asaccharovorans]
MSKPSWLDLKIGVGNIINLAALVCALIYGWAEMQANDRKQNEQIVALKATDAQILSDIKVYDSAVRAELKDIRAKTDTILDKLVDRQQATVERVVRVETKVDEILTRLPSRLP